MAGGRPLAGRAPQIARPPVHRLGVLSIPGLGETRFWPRGPRFATGRDFSYAPRRAKKKSTAITRANPTQPAAPDTAYPTGAPHPDPTHSPAHPPPSRLTPYPSPAHHLGPYQLTCPSLPYEKLLGKSRFHTIRTHTLRNALTKCTALPMENVGFFLIYVPYLLHACSIMRASNTLP